MYASNERYFSYLFMDTRTYLRYAYHVEKVNGRWVVAPPDGYYYLHSGEWMKVFAPLASIWWVVELVVILAGLAYRVTSAGPESGFLKLKADHFNEVTMDDEHPVSRRSLAPSSPSGQGNSFHCWAVTWCSLR